MQPTIRNLEAHWRGDTWGGFTVSATKINGVALTSNVTAIHCMFRQRNNPNKVYHLYNSAGITITDAAKGAYRIDPQIINFDASLYDYDIELTLANGAKYTGVAGTWTIKQDYTYGYH